MTDHLYIPDHFIYPDEIEDLESEIFTASGNEDSADSVNLKEALERAEQEADDVWDTQI
jgi:hypothetical protein